MKSIVLVVALMMLSSVVIAVEPNSSVLGMWTTEGGKSRVEIAPCGDKLCGTITWLKEPKYTKPDDGPVGATKTDRKNPDTSLRSRPLIGLEIMKGFVSTGANTWGGGAIYDPESGNTYRCKMKLISSKKLDVRGYIGFSFIGRTSAWTR